MANIMKKPARDVLTKPERPWRAGGDGRGILIPELPWKRKHKVELVETIDHPAEGIGAVAWYFACKCGSCGPRRRNRDIARHEGQWHEENA